MSQKWPPRHSLITGASGGLGRALALALASPDGTLSLLGRNAERLDTTAEACRALGAEVWAQRLDVTDCGAMRASIEVRDRQMAIDLVIANAGVSATIAGADSPASVLRTNIDGVMNTVVPLLAPMQARGGGRIGIVSSLAAFRGTPSAPAYCASKAAVRLWGEGLRGRMLAHGVAVSVICPGFIKTPMTDANAFPMPFMMSAEEAAGRICRGLERRAPQIIFPKRLYAAVLLMGLLPTGMVDRLLAKQPVKE